MRSANSTRDVAGAARDLVEVEVAEALRVGHAAGRRARSRRTPRASAGATPTRSRASSGPARSRASPRRAAPTPPRPRARAGAAGAGELQVADAPRSRTAGCPGPARIQSSAVAVSAGSILSSGGIRRVDHAPHASTTTHDRDAGAAVACVDHPAGPAAVERERRPQREPRREQQPDRRRDHEALVRPVEQDAGRGERVQAEERRRGRRTRARRGRAGRRRAAAR